MLLLRPAPSNLRLQLPCVCNHLQFCWLSLSRDFPPLPPLCSPEQKAAAEAYIAEISPVYRDKIVTEVSPASTFFPAEDYHQNYFEKNPGQGYCRAVVAPKVKKATEKFAALLK